MSNPLEHHALTNQKVTIIGMAREGCALARFLAKHHVQVTISDIRQSAQLEKELAQLKGLPITCLLGGHPEVILSSDIIYVSPGVPREIPILRKATEHGVPLSSQTDLFFELCEAPIIGITGSSGKTTTTTLIGEMLKGISSQVWVGGNIGRPLIEHLSQIQSTDWVVLELSSFQLENLAVSPHIAVMTNLRPNHLDRHSSYAAYKEAKANILRHQSPNDFAILNWDDEEVCDMARQSKAQVYWFSRQSNDIPRGMTVEAGQIVQKENGKSTRVMGVEEIALPGNHNLENILAALCTIYTTDISCNQQDYLSGATEVASTFKGVRHRLETIRVHDGVRWINDSIATSPDRTIAALRAFPNSSIILLAGGRDKHLPMGEMAQLIARQVKHLVLFGEAAPLIKKAVTDAGMTQFTLCQNLAEAVQLAATLASAPDIVLLSPSGTSFDAYPNYTVRGDHFRDLVLALA